MFLKCLQMTLGSQCSPCKSSICFASAFNARGRIGGLPVLLRSDSCCNIDLISVLASATSEKNHVLEKLTVDFGLLVPTLQIKHHDLQKALMLKVDLSL